MLWLKIETKETYFHGSEAASMATLEQIAAELLRHSAKYNREQQRMHGEQINSVIEKVMLKFRLRRRRTSSRRSPGQTVPGGFLRPGRRKLVEGIVLEIHGHGRGGQPGDRRRTEVGGVGDGRGDTGRCQEQVLGSESHALDHDLLLLDHDSQQVSIGDTSDCAAGVRTRGLEAFCTN